MCPLDEGPGEVGRAGADRDERIAALEQQVARLSAEVALLRASPRPSPEAPIPDGAAHRPPAEHASYYHDAFARAGAAAATISEDKLESLVGRYGTLALGALVILMGVGVLIQFAVVHGLLTPVVRVGIGALVAAGVGAAGVYFHRRGEVRYANVLLALALALTDLVAWGAGPQLHLIPTGAALAIVDVVALALAALALHDESEFLFCIAVAASLSSPFVTTEGSSAGALLAYGAVVLLGSMRAAREPRWVRAFAVMVAGALIYSLAAASLPTTAAWYAPFAVSLFGGVCALGALLLADDAWRGQLARAFLAVAMVGVMAGWDRIPASSAPLVWGVSLAMAAVTYAALGVTQPRQQLWTASALLLPFVSLGIALAPALSARAQSGVFALWTLFALAAWRVERLRGEPDRGGVHLLAGGLLGTIAIVLLLWTQPFALVVALAGWGVLMAAASRAETTPLPLVAVAVPLGLAALSAIDQLMTRRAYAYVPFWTRSSASALAATLGLALAGVVLARGQGEPSRWAERGVRLGAVIGFAIVWGRMEVAGAFTPDLAAFLLIAYYAACGLGSILAGRRFGVGRLRLAGLGLAVYAAVKAIAEASEIGSLPLRVGAYGAVGVFLLAAGYLYRERETGERTAYGET